MTTLVHLSLCRCQFELCDLTANMSHIQVEGETLAPQSTQALPKEIPTSTDAAKIDIVSVDNSSAIGSPNHHKVSPPAPVEEFEICCMHWYKFLWLTFFIYCICIAFYYMSLPNQSEPLRCIRVYFDAKSGQYECVNWDLRLVPLVGARELVPLKNTCPSSKLYIDGAGKYIVLIERDVTVNVAYPSSAGGEYSTSVTCKSDASIYFSPLPRVLEDSFILASVKKPLPVLQYDIENVLEMSAMQRLLYYALLSGAVVPSFECQVKEFALMEFQLQLSQDVSKYVSNAHHWIMLPSDVSFIKDQQHKSSWYTAQVSGTMVSLRVSFLSDTSFALNIQMQPAKYCGVFHTW